MKTRFKESGTIVNFNYHNDTVEWDNIRLKQWFIGDVEHNYMLPADYVEVEYIQLCNEDCIVIDDLFINYTDDIGVYCKTQMVNTDEDDKFRFLMGGGFYIDSSEIRHHSILTRNNIIHAGTILNSGYLEPTFDVNITLNNMSMQYVFDLYKSSGSNNIELKITNPFLSLRHLYDTESTSETNHSSNTNVLGPFTFFNTTLNNDDYPGYYCWAKEIWANITVPSSEEHTPYTHECGAPIGTRLYSNIVIYRNTPEYINHRDVIIKYLYTCYKKSTHQYGLYDVLSGKFYSGFCENEQGLFTNNSNYYFDNLKYYSNQVDEYNNPINSSLYEKESQFLNICGPC